MPPLALATIIQVSLLGAQESDFQRAYQQSTETGRPLVVLIGAEWCPACQQMKNSVLPQVAEAGGMSNVAFAYVDLDRQPDLVAQLSRGKSIPQLIRLTKTQAGWSSRVLVGSRTPTEVHYFLGGEPSAVPHQRAPARSVRDKDVSSKQGGWSSLFSAANRWFARLSQSGAGRTSSR